MVILGKSYYVEITFANCVWLLYTKILTMFHRITDALRWIPLRFKRILKHIYKGIKHFSKSEGETYLSGFEKLTVSGVTYWWLEFSVLILSLIGIAEIYETITDFIKFNTRSLTLWERKLLKGIYGKNINYDRVRIDNLGLIGPRQFRMCYVSFYTINSWGNMSNHLLVHEMMHVWQYQKMGAVYIPRALTAQNSAMGYNYGGLCALEGAIETGQGLKAFNLEQQADIITDYYLLREGYKAQWSDASQFDLPIYEKFIEQL
ncbi:MAG: hypothetical protein ACI85O_001906 [Saprospiraceae bacterium]|jgi:hypothetical protein